jgi:hypothetical protein
MRGMMFRTSIASDHGMLFVHPDAGLHSYWMYQTLIPLDMLWLDNDHKIVEMAENVPPCKTQASQCEHFGGTKPSTFVLELGGGMARRYGLHVGQAIEW